MDNQDLEPPLIRKYIYTCKSCRNKFRVIINIAITSIHEASCPQCNCTCKFDNRQKQLLLHEKNESRPSTIDKSIFYHHHKPDLTAQNRPEDQIHDPLSTNPSSISDKLESTNSFSGDDTGQPNGAPKAPKDNLQQEQIFINKAQHRTIQGSTKRKPIHKIIPFFKSYLKQKEAQRGLLFLLIFSIIIGFVAIASVRFPSLYLTNTPDSYLKKLDGLQVNKITDRNGELIGELFRKKTGDIQPSKIPIEMSKILVFVEDADFYGHSGIQWSAITRAFIKNIFSFGYSQGGSTITQQLARILLNNRDKNILRKLRETSLAYYLESKLTKDEILAGYMSQVYLGHGSLGFDNASEFYFDTTLDSLNFYQRLTLACLPSAPERYSPLRNPDMLFKKMKIVIERMEDHSFPIPKNEHFENKISSLFLSMNKSPSASIFGHRKNTAQWVSEHIRLQIRKILGNDLEYSAGLQIETTIDKKLQLKANLEVEQYIKLKAGHYPPVTMKEDKPTIRFGNDEDSRLRKSFEEIAVGPMLLGLWLPHIKRPRLQVAAVGIKSKTGEVLFLRGGSFYGSNNQLNRVTQMRRQTGSSIKPIVYSAAIESGAVHVATLLEDRPIFTIGGKSEKGYWLPGNYNGAYEGEVSVRTALAKSQNIPAIQVLRKAGLKRVSYQFKKFFFPNESVYKKRYREDETVAIGSLEMSPLEMAVAYTAFGNNGKIKRPYLIKKITGPEGKVLYNYTDHDEFNLHIPSVRQVIRPEAAEVMVSLMHDSARFGGITRGGFRGYAIGKTGTSNLYRDTWFVGATSDITAVVWVGYDEPKYSVRGGTGAGLAGPLWGQIMRHSLPVKSHFKFSPSAVKRRTCLDDGTLNLRKCKKIKNEIFLRKYLPVANKTKLDKTTNIDDKSKPNKGIGNDDDFD